MAYLVSENDQERFEILTKVTIGRGPFLEVTEKRVSRNHAVVQFQDGKLLIKPIHKNPTFFRENAFANSRPLPKDKWSELHDGNVISLLPKELIYSVRIEESNDVKNDEKNDVKSDIMGDVAGDVSNVVVDCRTDESKDDLKDDIKNVASICKDGKNLERENSKTESKDLDKAISYDKFESNSPRDQKKRKLPSWMLSLEQGSPSKKTQKGESSRKAQKTDKTQKVHSPVKSKTPSKKKQENSFPKDDISSKNISYISEEKDDTVQEDTKTEKSSLSLSNADPKDEMRQQESPTPNIQLDRGSPQPNLTKKKSDTPTDNTHKVKSKSDKDLPRCPYGSSCYRKNPLHFKEYSHSVVSEDDIDSNGDDDDRPECQYGTSCYRQNPQHKRDFKHTKNIEQDKASTKRKTRNQAKEKKKGKSVLENDSDDNGENNSYDYDDSFIDDNVLSSSYDDDDDDSDYIPADVKDDVGSDEDIDQLKNEAKDFIQNTKMQK